jgi:putative FmdB family regulatory protein
MPIYGYRCSSCGHEFEILQKMSDESLKTCPQCQGKLDKIIYPTGIIYKGSGYYTTDYKGTKAGSTNGTAPSPDGKTETKAEASSDSASEKKSEPKPESKPESKDSKSQKDS